MGLVGTHPPRSPHGRTAWLPSPPLRTPARRGPHGRPPGPLRTALLLAILVANLAFIAYLGLYFRNVGETLEDLQVGDEDLILEHPGPHHLIYVPVYSHVYFGAGEPYQLTATLSVRNTDPRHSITLTSVRYYDTDGKQVRSYLDEQVPVPPLASTEFVVEELDRSGGSGANFLVEWAAPDVVNRPIIEAVMIGASNDRGISFVSPGRKVIDQSGE